MSNIDRATNVASLLTEASKNAGEIALQNQQTPEQKVSALDVWSHSNKGMKERMKSFTSDPMGNLDRYGKELDAAVVKGIKGDWARSSFSQCMDSAIAQKNMLGGQLKAISDAKGALATVGATFSFLTSIEQMISTAVSMIPFPAFPALRILDFAAGLPHGHAHPPTFGVPLPSVGPIIPIPILSGAIKTLINGMPAARCGDMGIGVWCGGYFPMYEIFLGSSNVWIEGNRASRILVDITKHCIFADPPIGPMIGFTISSSTNVSIGGVPMPSLLNLAIGAVFKLLFKGVGKAVSWVRQSRLRNLAESADEITQVVRRPPPLPSAKLSIWQQALAEALHTPGMRKSVKGINVQDLAALTRATRDEWAVVMDKQGRLTVIRGQGASCPVKNSDIVLAHTHPSGNLKPSSLDLKGYAEAGQKGKVVDEAIITPDGKYIFYNDKGIVDPEKAIRPFDSKGDFG